MNILITGANGFVGKALTNKLAQLNHTLKAVVRSDSVVKNAQVVIKTLSKNTVWSDALEGVDTVIHLAGRAHVMQEHAKNPYQAYAEINVDATRHLAEQAVTSGVKRFIFLSSIKVNGEQTSELAFTELDVPKPEDDYGKTKSEAESILNNIANNSKMEVVIIRPPLIYGKGVKANFKSLIKLGLSGIPLPFGAIHNMRSFIYIENLIDFIVLCTHHQKAANQLFLISDDEDISITQLIKYISKANRVPSILIPIPKAWLAFILKLIGKESTSDRLLGNLQVNISKAKALLEWKPLFTVGEGIAKTLEGKDD